MNELIQAWTRAGNAVAAYYEKAGSPLLTVPAQPEAPDSPTAIDAELRTRTPRKPRAVKEPAAPAPTFDPMMDMGGAAAPSPAAPAAPVAMSEAESTAGAQDANKRLVKAFPTILSADKMPEGFHKAKALLSEFGVARTTDLVHAQRVQYIAKIDALIVGARA